MAKSYKLNIFQALAKIDQCEGGWLAKQPDAVRREFIPLTALRWTVSVPDSEMACYNLWLVNERVNIHLWKLQQRHPDLLFRLLASCGFGTALEHRWLAGPGGRGVADKARALVADMHPECNDDEITTLLSLHDRVSFKQFIDECGVQPDDAKAILAAFNGQSSKTNPQGSETSGQGNPAQGRKTKAATAQM